jgi:hypothetical protein
MKRWIVGALLAAGCGNAPSEEECKRLLEHLVDLEFKKAGTAGTGDAMKAELAKQKQTVSEARTGEFVEACSQKTAKSRVECALAATDLEAVRACDEAK